MLSSNAAAISETHSSCCPNIVKIRNRLTSPSALKMEAAWSNASSDIVLSPEDDHVGWSSSVHVGDESGDITSPILVEHSINRSTVRVSSVTEMSIENVMSQRRQSRVDIDECYTHLEFGCVELSLSVCVVRLSGIVCKDAHELTLR